MKNLLFVMLFVLVGCSTQNNPIEPVEPTPQRTARVYRYSYYVWEMTAIYQDVPGKPGFYTINLGGAVNSRDTETIPGLKPIMSLFDSDIDLYRSDSFFTQDTGSIGQLKDGQIVDGVIPQDSLAPGEEAYFFVKSKEFHINDHQNGLYYEFRFDAPVFYMGKMTTTVRGFIQPLCTVTFTVDSDRAANDLYAQIDYKIAISNGTTLALASGEHILAAHTDNIPFKITVQQGDKETVFSSSDQGAIFTKFTVTK
jgi:hypothetical protein